MAQTTTKKRATPAARSPAAVSNAALLAQLVRPQTEGGKRRGGVMTKAPKGGRAKKMSGPLPFFAQVEVVKRRGVPPEFVGRKGVILGRAQLAGGGWNYGVFFEGASYYLPHTALKPTSRSRGDRGRVF